LKSPARTISRETSLEGVGIHSGVKVRLRLRPAPPGAGVSFVRSDLPGAPRLTLKDFCLTGQAFRSTLKSAAAEVYTIEHLLSALNGLGLTDLEAALDGPEPPGLDGSALPFAAALRSAGLVEAAGQGLDAVAPQESVTVQEGFARITLEPWTEGLRITYLLDYPGEPLAQGTLSLVVTPDGYLRELAPARTFCLYREAQALLAAGFGKGAGTHNTVVLDGGRVLGQTLRFPDEPVRHKICDLLGDLYLLGRPLRGHVRAERSGHRLNHLLVQRLAREFGAP
jgi:UDP-3-O-[3-hydroxymyristoyl] N-acetylglucosamine deacetylase